MDSIIKDLIIGVLMPSSLLGLIIRYVVIPLSEKYIEYVDRSMKTMDMIVVNQNKCAEIQDKVLQELKSLKRKV